MTTSALVTISTSAMSAEINTFGAELWRLRDGEGRDLLWNGDPAYWTGRAPILFPIVGAVKDDRVVVGGMPVRLAKHGFARRSQFSVVELAESSVRLRLEPDDVIRSAWPYAFRLDVTFTLTGARLDMSAKVTNRDDRTMPFCFGWHPAFAWPLPYGAGRGDHKIRFDRPEPADLRQLGDDALISAEPRPTPVAGRELFLRDSLFGHDALIWDTLNSERLVYGAPGAKVLDIAFPGMPHLGIWTKPGAGYVCVEPWAGHADLTTTRGTMEEKPGVVMLKAGATERFVMSVELADAPPDF